MKKSCLSLLLLVCASMLRAENPIIRTCFTTDPAPMVHDGRLYLYTGHDERGADFFWMQEWRVYSTDDMVNWTDHGSPLAIESFAWGDDRAWAAQCIERNGKFYWYVCLHSKISGGMAIGVAVGDSPIGPFRDALGKPLFENGSWDHIDPTVFIDDDGQAYLYWGNPHLYYLRLNEDMISYSGEVTCVEMSEESFGAPNPARREEGKQYRDCYIEGPWLMKRDKLYYMLYAAGGIPEHIAYSTAPSPTGPWSYRGEAMPLQDSGSFTNHCGVVNYRGHDYFFYHTGKLPGGKLAVETPGGTVVARAKDGLAGGDVFMDMVTVGGTINVMLAASRAQGTTTIYNAAKEPHIVDLANFLNSMGASVKGAGTDTIRIKGVKHLHGSVYSVIPDQIETGTLMIAAAATRGDVVIRGCIPTHMEALTAKLLEMGVQVSDMDDAIRVRTVRQHRAVNIKTQEYPGFPTDLQQPMSAMLTKANGDSVVIETIFEPRLKHLIEMQRMGAKVRIVDQTAIIEGVPELYGAPVTATDLRAGAALVVAGLMAKGVTEIYEPAFIARGYEHIEEKLQALGAKIHREDL